MKKLTIKNKPQETFTRVKSITTCLALPLLGLI